MSYFVHLTRNNLIECLVVKVVMKFRTNLKLFMKAQIKLKSLKLVDTLDKMNCFKWDK